MNRNPSVSSSPYYYELDDYQINHLHFSNYEGYDRVFNSSFGRNHYLSLLLIKRPAFYYENEFRYFIVPKKGTVNKQTFPTIRWADMVDQIKVDSACTEIEMEILTKYLREYKINFFILLSLFNLYYYNI